ncbi:MAG: DUF559 domain-containing protein [Gemmatimonas sp.]|uniref:DUF559 domain-containing protein n=1 Tax=Gemmatimonas sp. TaxID=1962908 RepID=UPI00391F9C9B
MRSTLKAIGHRPRVRGGNGTGLTRSQWACLEILGSEWVAELAIPTGRRKTGIATCYKLDLAHTSLKIGIELEGRTHNGKRLIEDAKKDAFLASLGWRVYRVLNADAERLCSTCTSADTLLTSLQAFSRTTATWCRETTTPATGSSSTRSARGTPTSA